MGQTCERLRSRIFQPINQHAIKIQYLQDPRRKSVIETQHIFDDLVKRVQYPGDPPERRRENRGFTDAALLKVDQFYGHLRHNGASSFIRRHLQGREVTGRENDYQTRKGRRGGKFQRH